jgi:hypothetical protein
MKKILKYIIVLCFITLFIACEKEVEEPEILLFEAVPSTINVGESVTFRIQVEADYISLWPGFYEEGGRNNRNYEKYLEEINNPPDVDEAVNRFYNKGLALSITDTAYVYSLYSEPGLYDVVLIVTNAGKLGEEYKRKQASLQVEVLEAQ